MTAFADGVADEFRPQSDASTLAPRLAPQIDDVSGDLAGHRAPIGAEDVWLFDNISPEFSSAIGGRGIAERAKGASFLGVVAILISGPTAGVPFAMGDLSTAKNAAPVVVRSRSDRPPVRWTPHDSGRRCPGG